jgi:hypothetical protein
MKLPWHAQRSALENRTITNPVGRSALGGVWNSIQSWLFPMLEDEIGELDEKHRQFVAVCELCAP